MKHVFLPYTVHRKQKIHERACYSENQGDQNNVAPGYDCLYKDPCSYRECIPFLYTEPGYSEMLPTYQSLDLDQLIQQAIDQSSNQSMTLIDCGCGKSGAFLRSCEEHWRGRGLIYGVGITARKMLTREEDLSLISRNISII